jgi:hypothetical protein
MVQVEQDLKCHLEESLWSHRDRRGDAENKALLVEESLVAAERDANLLREGRSKRAIHHWDKRHIEGHLPHWQDDTPTVKEGVHVADGVTHDKAKARPRSALADLTEIKGARSAMTLRSTEWPVGGACRTCWRPQKI